MRDVKERIEALRNAMKERDMDAYLIPSGDFHGSEYVNDYFKCRRFMSGFTGSAGTLIVTREEAALWTDGRYFLQAAMELEGSGIRLMKMEEENVPTVMEYLEEKIPGGRLGFDGRVVSAKEAEEYGKAFELCSEEDLVDPIWTDRPAIVPSEIYALPRSVTGEAFEEKLERVREKMEEKEVYWHLISCLEDIAWLFNLRGSDVANTPVFYAFAIVGTEDVALYVMDKGYNAADIEGVSVLPYERIYGDLAELDGDVLLDKSQVNYRALQSLPSHIDVLDEPNPEQLMKAVKNEVEIESTRQAHIRDGAAVTEFIHWVKEAVKTEKLTEIKAAEHLEQCRRRQEGFKDLSFTTIPGYMDNGAIIHYSPTAESDKELRAEGFLLVDSGGQYKDGTTDITRTVVLGPITADMKKHYTLVLKGHISLATAKFNLKTTGTELDELARGPLKEEGLNYNHGTGHGVGHLLSVHEGPQSISKRGNDRGLVPGMITSNEPGLYLEGEYGIRLENEILCRSDNGRNLYFETMTLCPFDREAIDAKLLTEEERRWLNDYHRKVRETLRDRLNESDRRWLEEVTAEI